MSSSKRARQRTRSRAAQGTTVRLWPVLIIVVAILGIGGFFFLRNVIGSPAATPKASDSAAPPADAASAQPGEAVPIQGNAHVKEGDAHPDYNSDPPTSGWHLGRAIPAGFYEEPQLDETLVHNLEHGHVVIAYDCGKLADCEAIKAKLKDLVNRYDGWKVTVVPRQNRDTAIGLTAWGRIDKLDAYDEARITAFIDAYRDQGPEKTPQ